MNSLAEIEAKLGKPHEYVVNPDHAGLLRKWAVIKGHGPLVVYNMKLADLVNLYTASNEGKGESLTAETIKDLSVKLFVEIMQFVSVPGFNVETTRQVTREELLPALQSEVIAPVFMAAARKAFAELPARKLEVFGPTGTGTIDGVVHKSTELVLRVVSLGHSVMMVGPAGSGKTTIGEHVAKALNLPFYITNAIQETHQLSGFVDGYGKYHATPFRHAFEYGGVWVADEIDAWDAGALLAANSALANGYMSFPDVAQPVKRHPFFRMIATANTFGTGADRVYIGRNQLDAASLDRFAMITVDYDENLERMFAGGNDAWLHYVHKIRRVIQKLKIRHVVSSRAVAMGAAALRAGLTNSQVEQIYLFKGMSESDRKKIDESTTSW